MSLKLLVVEGNPKPLWEARLKKGLDPYHQQFIDLLKWMNPAFHIDSAFPADADAPLPGLDNLRDYHGILWTGGSLNAYKPLPEITKQIDFMEYCFNSGTPIYGSCWGMQIAAMASGGQVALCKNKREFGIAKDIEITKQGIRSGYFAGKPNPLAALCIHEDEVAELPTNSEILASNPHSPYQAITIQHKQSAFFGVQYHPEFSLQNLADIANNMADRLVEEGFFADVTAVNDYAKELAEGHNIPTEVSDFHTHSLEIRHWLNSLH